MITRYLIAKGELLTKHVPPPAKRDVQKTHPYSFKENREVLLPQLAETNRQLRLLPEAACPADQAVAKFTLHPAYIAKTQFPRALLQDSGLESVGSRNRLVGPRHGPIEQSTELFVAGTRTALRGLQDRLSALTDEDSAHATDFRKFESIAAMTPLDRIRGQYANWEGYWEVGLHLTRATDADAVRESFGTYAASCGFALNDDFRFDTGHLLFVPVGGASKQLTKLAEFTLLRVIRPMPRLRSARPVARTLPVAVPFQLPAGGPYSREPRVAILDGGLPDVHVLEPHVRRHILADDHAEGTEEFSSHGLAVTSAFLFGPIQPGQRASRPFSLVDHHRVLDAETAKEDGLELYRTLAHIESILLSRNYEFLNLSLGPDECINDDDVHAWTAVIDDRLSDGRTLLTVAVGNNGEGDAEAGTNRIQVPADCVNALCVGSATEAEDEWERAPYSALGPGRSPGRRKPDLLAFGGMAPNYFHVVSPGPRPHLAATHGTSFAAPLALRSAVAIRAILGPEITPLTIKALLISGCERGDNDNPHECGWGRIPADVHDVITCPDGVARIIFQGTLTPGKYLRAPIPLPRQALHGDVVIMATFCYASPVDPQDTAMYTKAGLEVAFRPHEDKKSVDKKTGLLSRDAVTDTFFEPAGYRTESQLRGDLGKWETVLHQSQRYRSPGTRLKNPAFDIHYNARNRGANGTASAKEIAYSLVITVKASKHLDLYDQILQNHVQLQSLQPLMTLPLRT